MTDQAQRLLEAEAAVIALADAEIAVQRAAVAAMVLGDRAGTTSEFARMDQQLQRILADAAPVIERARGNT